MTHKNTLEKLLNNPSEELLLHLSPEGILRLTMNRPEVHNAFDDHQIIRMTEVLEAASESEAVKVVILGSEGRSFSAGGDLNYMRRMGQNSYEENYADASRLAKLLKVLNFLPQPTIARVQGAAFGGGVGLICCCDMAIGTPRVKMALSEVKLGMVPATIGPYVVRTLGEKAARRLFITGEIVRAEEAKSLGFLNAIVEEEGLDGMVNEWAQKILKNAPNAVRAAKKLVFDVSSGEVTKEMIEGTIKLIADTRDSEEGREGLTAFLEKRPPSWLDQTD